MARTATKTARDPTNTGAIRHSFRLAAGNRISQLQSITRTMLADHDTLGLGADATLAQNAIAAMPNKLRSLLLYQTAGMSDGDKLKMFVDWFNNTAYNTLVGQDGGWTRDYIERAHLTGLRDAAKEVKQPSFLMRSRNAGIIVQQTAHELQGVADATVQAVSREVANQMLAQSRPVTLARAVNAQINKVALNRTKLLANTQVVHAYNSAKLDVYKTVGLRKVGVLAERNPVTKRQLKQHVHDAAGDGEDLVEVLTAGDDLVCQECEDISNDGPYPLDEADGLIPAHPNCRCAFVPFYDERFAEVERD